MKERVGVVEGREFRTANYVNCQCCKLPSQFAFILHTIHTVPAHLARNPSTRILLLPSRNRVFSMADRAKRKEQWNKKKKERMLEMERDPSGTHGTPVVRHNRYSTTRH